MSSTSRTSRPDWSSCTCSAHAWCGSPRCVCCLPCSRRSDQLADRVDQYADQGAHNSAVDPDELQIPADLKFQTAPGLIGIPTGHRRGYEPGDVLPVPRCHVGDHTL